MTTTPQPQVDIEELAHYFTPEPTYADGATIEARSCARCGEWYALSDEATEPTRFCHNCAHLLCEESLPALIAEVRALRAKAQGGGWIPCSERMPTDESPCVVLTESYGHPGPVEFALYERPTWRWMYPTEDDDGDDVEYIESTVTHWMPLPAPPEAT